MFYLVKTGGDARMFPELLPHKWFNDIYNIKWKLLEVLQYRRRQTQMATLARELDHEFMPHDLQHGGEAYYSKLIAKENTNMENQVNPTNDSVFSCSVPVRQCGIYLCRLKVIELAPKRQSLDLVRAAKASRASPAFWVWQVSSA